MSIKIVKKIRLGFPMANFFISDLCAFKVSKSCPGLENHPKLRSLCTQETEHNHNNIVGRAGEDCKGWAGNSDSSDH